MNVEKYIDLNSLVKFGVILVAVVGSFVWLQSDVQKLKIEQDRMNEHQSRMQIEMRREYVNREQLDYIVIQRLERMEERMGRRFDELKNAIEENNY